MPVLFFRVIFSYILFRIVRKHTVFSYNFCSIATIEIYKKNENTNKAIEEVCGNPCDAADKHINPHIRANIEI